MRLLHMFANPISSRVETAQLVTTPNDVDLEAK
jgi:hypothetical protein